MKSIKIFFIILLYVICIYQLRGEENAKIFNQFTKISPDTKEALGLKTQVKSYNDDQNIYFEWDCELDNSFYRGRKAADETFEYADFLRVQLITSPKDYFGYFFIAYPEGQKLDGIRDKKLNISYEWNSQYTYENQIDSTHWHCLMKIPFKDLRYFGSNPYEWKVIFTRYTQNDESYYSCPYVTNNFKQAYFLSGEDVTIDTKLPRNYNIRLIPYTLANWYPQNTTDNIKVGNPGLDFSFTPTSALNTKIAINPDFSDVPMDYETDNSNLKYAPTFEENRYFFIEDLDVFNITDIDFYTRNILQPQWAGKITGNNENMNYGFLLAKDKEIEAIDNKDDLYGAIGVNYKTDREVYNNNVYFRIEDKAKNILYKINPIFYYNRDTSLSLSNTVSYFKQDRLKSKSDMITNITFKHQIKDFEVSCILNQFGKEFVNLTGSPIDLNYSAIYLGTEYDKENIGNFKELNFSTWINTSYKNYQYNFMEHSTGISGSINTIQNYNYNFTIGSFSTNIGNNRYYSNSLSLGLSYTKSGKSGIGVSYYTSNSYQYTLAKQARFNSIGLWAWSYLTDKLYIYSKQNYYDYPKEQKSDFFDNKYYLINTELIYTFKVNLQLKSGFRYNASEYKLYNLHGLYGFYANMSWEFYKNYFIYGGFNRKEHKYTDWDIEQQTVFVKLRAILNI